MKRISATVLVSCILTASLSVSDPRSATGADAKFDVNDISFLWPAPKSAADVQKLINITETGSDGAAFLPTPLLQQVLSTATTLKVQVPNGPERVITLGTGFDQPANWKIVSIRVDPAAPGTNPEIQKKSPVGVQPQVRLIVQPVTVAGGSVKINDFTAHLVFSFDNSPDGSKQNASFAPVVSDLAAIKADLKAKGTDTSGALGVHPGFTTPDLTDKLRAFLKKHLKQSRLGAVAFMGTVESSEPWIFFAMAKGQNGQFAVAKGPQMFSRRDSAPVFPIPQNNTFGAEGLSTSPLFGPAVNLDALLFPNSADPRLKPLQLRDIPDAIANPDVCFFFNTDCVSCHSESTRRGLLKLAVGSGRLHYERPAGISGPNDALVPNDIWNVRNFGWFPFKEPMETVTLRTANEAAASVDFVNRIYLTPSASPATSAGPVASSSPTVAGRKVVQVSQALTLVMKIKSADDAQQLRAFLTQSQNMPPEKNPISVALTNLGLVHDARFVFIGADQLAVITTYDGDFDTYIHAFADEIGPIFDELLKHMEGAPKLPVCENTDEFLKYIKQHDLQAFGGLYSAYPTLSVQDIQILQQKALESSPAAKPTTGVVP